MKNILTLSLLFFFGTAGTLWSQSPPDSAWLAEKRTFRNLSDALLQPDSVFKLDLSRQKRKAVPEEIRRLKALRILRLKGNNLRELPDWIGELKNLQELDVSNNRLTALPPGIGELDSLRFLGLNRNLIETLPREIGNLKALEVLEMWDNEVQVLPEEIRLLSSLRIFELRGILFSREEQEQIQNLLPDTQIYFSPHCNCKN